MVGLELRELPVRKTLSVLKNWFILYTEEKYFHITIQSSFLVPEWSPSLLARRLPAQHACDPLELKVCAN